ncbi:MAG: hypothetical protein ACE5GY_07310 [Thermodesulfobacteriota bacterium]
MLRTLVIIFVAVVSLYSNAMAQDGLHTLISPGDLARPHAKYEGITKCTKCHRLGGGLPDRRCLDCHDRLDAQIKSKKGIHVKFKDACVKCHGDHKGRGYKMISINEEDFNHDRTDYLLRGKHEKLRCSKCHKKEGLYTGLKQGCASCHTDEHKKQLGNNCGKCHTVAGWKALDRFNHDRDSGYRLTFKHANVKCARCHAKGRFKPVAHNKCDVCHRDEHRGQFKGRRCKACHTTKGWKKDAFDHAAPSYKGYRLEGRHREVKCGKCHAKGRFKPVEHKKCDACHRDEHRGQFKGRRCKACHTTKGWKKDAFDHAAPSYKGYRLEGRHREVKCGKCHAKGRFKPVEHKKCDACHRDEHRGQFKGKRCEVCHTTNGWKKVIFNHNAPQYSSYRLDGKHEKVKCARCHVKGRYKPIDPACLTCHKKDDVHKKELGRGCKKCHTPADWKKTTLDHNRQTKFPLVGAHRETRCDRCHKTKNRYKAKERRCLDCHRDPHKGEFKEGCTSCHTQYNWRPRNFDHSKRTGYALKGVHNDVVCQSCHVTKGVYKRVNRFCNQCHADPHFNQFGGKECSQCHGERSWGPTQFNHSAATAYPLIGSHRAVECKGCHTNRLYRSTPAACRSCHQERYASAPKHLAGNYSQDCTQCHFSTFVNWSYRHIATGANCSSCHLSMRPATHTADPASYPTTCELCHTSTSTWTAHRHTTAKTGCSSCHMSMRPATHLSNPSAYPTTCENCHAYPGWASVAHSTSTSANCNNCHSSATPAAHKTYSSRFGTVCQNCHRYPSWLPGSINHGSFSSFPTGHKGYSRCSDCHPARNYGNKGGCIECHSSRGAKVHKTGSNSGCLGCHPTGRE